MIGAVGRILFDDSDEKDTSIKSAYKLVMGPNHDLWIVGDFDFMKVEQLTKLELR